MKTIIVGAGGHARVICSIFDTSYTDINVIGFIDNYIRTANEKIYDRPIIGRIEDLSSIIYNKIAVAAIVGIGDNGIRKSRYEAIKVNGFAIINAIHKTSIISPDAIIGQGVVICPGVVLNVLTTVGNNTIINTGAIIDHETRVGEHSHIGPGANIAGRVNIGNGTIIGIGSTIKEYINIGNNVTVGAGTVVVADVPDNSVVVGVPGKVIKKKVNNTF